MAKQNNLRQTRLILYRLRRNYGQRITLRRYKDESVDYASGKLDIDFDDYGIWAIVTSFRIARDFSYDLAFIAANKNFTYGGFYDETSKFVMIDAKDLPTAITNIQTSDRFIHEGQEYDLDHHAEAESKRAWLLRIKRASGVTHDN